MKRLNHLLPALPLLLLLWLLPCSCVDEESALGVNLVDGNTLYNGQQTTLYASRALSVRDDSLMTTGYNNYNAYGIIGNYHDATFGSVSATLYTQIALPDNSSSINLETNIIDSVVLSLVKNQVYPDTSATYNFHFEVMQLAEALVSDSNLYYSTHTLPVNSAARYFDDDVTVAPTDTIVRLKLDNSIQQILNQTASAEEFIESTKGLRIRITDAADEGMFSINFLASNTCLTVYHHYPGDTTSDVYTFLLGNGATRFTHFEHDYTGSITGGTDSLDGSNTLYLEPLAGYSIYLSFDSMLHDFALAHPTATVHHAELLLPLAAGADAIRPNQLLAREATGNQNYVDDLNDLYTLAGFDGKYDESRGCYRLRITQHVQGLLRKGHDDGLLVVINARQSTAARTKINGPSASDPVRIEIVYSE